MNMRRPPRLHPSVYVGPGRFFLTFRAFPGTRPFASEPTVEAARAQLLRAAASHGYSVLAYCFMPDHLHVLVEAVSSEANLCRFAKAFKQQSGFEYACTRGERLWQEGYYDKVLRRDESTRIVAWYIWNNPVRKGWVADFRDWPHSGSQVYDIRRWGRV